MRLVEEEIQHLNLRWGKNEPSKLHKQRSFTHKQKKKQKQAIFTVLGHVVEAQHLPQNPANLTFKTELFMGR
jgi:predicted transcriptional regulator